MSYFLECNRTFMAVVINIRMSNAKSYFYAVGIGRKRGVYSTWAECQQQVEGVYNAKFKKFNNKPEAEKFVEYWQNYTSPGKGVGPRSYSKESAAKTNTVLRKVVSYDSYNYRRPWQRPLNVENTERRHYRWNIQNNSNESSGDALSYNAFVTNPLLVPPLLSLQFSQHENHFIPLCKFENVPREQPSALKDSIYYNVKSFSLFRCKDRTKDDYVFNFLSIGDVYEILKKRPRISTSDSDKSTASVVTSPSVSLNSLFTPTTEFRFLLPDDPKPKERNSSSVFSDISLSPTCPLPAEAQDVIPEVDPVVKGRSSVEKSEENRQESTSKSELASHLEDTVARLKEALETNSRSDLTNTFASILSMLLEEVVTNPINPRQMVHDGEKKFLQPGSSAEGEAARTSAEDSGLATLGKSKALPNDGQNVDFRALTLRLDSFEKRFDDCLKQMGGIVAEMNHTKAEILDIKKRLDKHTGTSTSVEGGYQVLAGTSKRSFAHKSESLKNVLSGACDPVPLKPSSSRESETTQARKKGQKRSLSQTSDTFDIQKEENSSKLIKEEGQELESIKKEKYDWLSFIVDDEEFVHVYTDGACINNGKANPRAGIGVWFGDDHPMNVAQPASGPPTNNNAEIEAARTAIELAAGAGINKVKVHTDSSFLINGITEYMPKWKERGWKLSKGGPIKNLVQFRKLDEALNTIAVEWVKVPAHSGVYGNEMADQLANQGAEMFGKGNTTTS